MLLCCSLMKFVGHVQVYIGKSFCKEWLLGYTINNLHILTLILMVDNMIKYNMNHFSDNRLIYFCWYGLLKMDFSGNRLIYFCWYGLLKMDFSDNRLIYFCWYGLLKMDFSDNRLIYFCWYGLLNMDFSLHLTSKVIPSMLYSYQKSILAKPINDSV